MRLWPTSLILLLPSLGLLDPAFSQEEPARQPIYRTYFGHNVNGSQWWCKDSPIRPKFGMSMAAVEKIFKNSDPPNEGIGYVTQIEPDLSEDGSVRWHFEKDTKFIYWVYTHFESYYTLTLYDSTTIMGQLTSCAIAVNFDRSRGTVVNSIKMYPEAKEEPWHYDLTFFGIVEMDYRKVPQSRRDSELDQFVELLRRLCRTTR